MRSSPPNHLFRVDLSITSSVVAADVVSDRLGIKPDSTWTVGELQVETDPCGETWPNPQGLVAKVNKWKKRAKFWRDKMLGEQVEGLRSVLRSIADHFGSLQSECEVLVKCVAHLESRTFRYEFTRHVVKELAAAGTHLCVDVYFSEIADEESWTTVLDEGQPNISCVRLVANSSSSSRCQTGSTAGQETDNGSSRDGRCIGEDRIVGSIYERDQVDDLLQSDGSRRLREASHAKVVKEVWMREDKVVEGCNFALDLPPRVIGRLAELDASLELIVHFHDGAPTP